MSDDEKSSLIRKENSGTSSSTSYYGTEQTATHTNNDSTPTQEEDSSTSSTPDDGSKPLPLDQMRSSLTFLHKFGFGLGHVLNDLCAGVWFSYTLLFMQGVLKMPGAEAGALVMLGQVADALATPIVGVLVDKYGTKRKWHIAGTGLVFLTFPLIFSLCPWCTDAPTWWQPTYFAIVIVLFQLGWAVVQITHLAMIPEMARTKKDRAELTAIRYSASVTSNVMVYLVTWSVLRESHDKNIGASDADRFRVSSKIGKLFTFKYNYKNYVTGRLAYFINAWTYHDSTVSFLLVSIRLWESTSLCFR